MRILFWNVQRLGGVTDDVRRTIIGNVFYAMVPDLILLCELTTASLIPKAQNITYRVKGKYQLCYGAIDANGTDIPLTRVNPAAGPKYANQFIGGNNFSNLVNRALACVGFYNNYNIYVFHAPACQFGAERALTFLTYALDALHPGANWLVIGDLNIEPWNLSDYVQNYVFQSSSNTYIGGIPKMYDYVLSNNFAGFTLNTVVPSGPGSDHLPIVLDF